jgi:4-diphosphocytidyl-2-C-methyl-D-erythritol kinase
VPLVEKAPAKLNLGLRIVGKREDGYHDILSVFQTVGLYDELTITPSTESGIECSEPGVPADRNNLVLKAEDCFKKNIGIDDTSHTHFFLKKRIPVGAGLGGGSSDAAAALRGLTRFYNVEISDRVFNTYAEELGSDVFFLIKGGTAVVSGRGETVTFVQWPFDFTYVIVYPGFGVSTAWAYGAVGECWSDMGDYQPMTEKLKKGTLEADEFFRALMNDFEPVVFNKYPLLKQIKTDLIKCGARAALLTGSGSCMTGIFENEEEAVRCAKILKNGFAGVYIVKACP